MVFHSKLFTDFSGNSYHDVLDSGNESCIAEIMISKEKNLKVVRLV